MKRFSLSVTAAAILLTGCATTSFSPPPGTVREETYVGLNSHIPKKGARQPEDQLVNLQQLENDRQMNRSELNGGPTTR